MNLNAFDFDRSASKKRLKIKIRQFNCFSPPFCYCISAPWCPKPTKKRRFFFWVGWTRTHGCGFFLFADQRSQIRPWRPKKDNFFKMDPILVKTAGANFWSIFDHFWSLFCSVFDHFWSLFGWFWMIFDDFGLIDFLIDFWSFLKTPDGRF